VRRWPGTQWERDAVGRSAHEERIYGRHAAIMLAHERLARSTDPLERADLLEELLIRLEAEQ
jgi:hypothetical protein